MISESEVSEYITKGCAIVSGHALDYLVLSVPNSRMAARSYAEHARVQCEGKATTEVVAEVWGHVEDIIATATADGKPEVVFRINLFRAKQPGGSRTWRTDTAPGSNRDDDDTDTGGMTSMAGALVGGMKEIRLALREALAMVGTSAAEGWRIAGEAIKAERTAREENAELMVVLGAKQEEKDDPMKLIAVKAVSEIIDFAKLKAMLTAQEESAQKVADIQNNTTKKEG